MGPQQLIELEHQLEAKALARMLDGPYHRKTMLRSCANVLKRMWQWLVEPTRG